MYLRSSSLQYLGLWSNSASVLRFEHTEKGLRRGDMGFVKQWVAVKEDALKPLSIYNLKR